MSAVLPGTPSGPPPEEAPPVAVRLVRVRVPLRRTHRSAHGVEAVRDSVLVASTSADGTVGWSECPTLAAPGYATETTDEAYAALATVLAPAALAGRPVAAPGRPAATAALLDATLDARLRAAGRSLAAELGATRRTVPVGVVLADVGGDPERIAARAAAAVDAGAALVKVKVAPGADVEVVAAARAAVGDSVPLAADANGSYEAGSPELAALDRCGLAYLEQPVAPGATWDDLARLRRSLRTPVALDESLVSADAVRAAVLAGAVDVVSVKPSRLGGVRAAAAAVAECAARGVDCFVGGMFELGVGRATAAAVAALDGCTSPTDLGPSERYVDEDVCDPVVLDDDGRLVVPAGPGCGRVPREDRLARWTVDEVVLGR